MDISKHLDRDGIGSLLQAYPRLTFLVPLFEAATRQGSGKVDPKMLLELGMPAMRWVAKHESHALENGASPTIQDQHGFTSLHYTIYARNLLLVYHLLTSGANSNINDAYDKQGMAELHYAAWQKGIARIVNFPLNHGAEINKLSPGHGQTALHYAA